MNFGYRGNKKYTSTNDQTQLGKHAKNMFDHLLKCILVRMVLMPKREQKLIRKGIFLFYHQSQFMESNCVEYDQFNDHINDQIND